jgi:NAD(P)-dependent dehydrogenase (short-subunit alcohol dehydrogenase family)
MGVSPPQNIAARARLLQKQNNMSTVLLIGASRGIGFELARQYLADGWRVIATARSDEGLANLKALGAQTLRLDVANPASNSGLSWQLDGEKIDLAIYVAGAMDRASASTPPTRDSFDAVMHTNVMGAMQVIPQIVPMVQETHGVIACISSVMGSLHETTSGNAVLYRVSKAALNMVVRCTQSEQPDVTVLAIHPGWVQTDMGGEQAPLTPEQSASSLRQTLSQVLEQRDPKHRGAFLNHDGQSLPW